MECYSLNYWATTLPFPVYRSIFQIKTRNVFSKHLFRPPVPIKAANASIHGGVPAPDSCVSNYFISRLHAHARLRFPQLHQVHAEASDDSLRAAQTFFPNTQSEWMSLD